MKHYFFLDSPSTVANISHYFTKSYNTEGKLHDKKEFPTQTTWHSVYFWMQLLNGARRQHRQSQLMPKKRYCSIPTTVLFTWTLAYTKSYSRFDLSSKREEANIIATCLPVKILNFFFLNTTQTYISDNYDKASNTNQ